MTTKTQNKIISVQNYLNRTLIERTEEVSILMSSLLCKEHPLLIGPPGTGKSYMLDSLMECLDSNAKFNILLNKFSTPEEVFGPISVMGLKQDQYRRILEGRLPKAEAAFIDEIFKGSSSILNTTLKILNEGTYDNGNGPERCPLMICVAASNEWPQEQKELNALFDRFLLRKTVNYVSRSARATLIDPDGIVPGNVPKITKDEVMKASQEVAELWYTWDNEIKDCYMSIVDQLNKEGIIPGDRRIKKSVNVVSAFSYLQGKSSVEMEDLEILKHCLWVDPAEQPIKAASIVYRMCCPEQAIIQEALFQIETILKNNSPQDILVKLKDIRDKLKKLKTSKTDSALKYVNQCIKNQMGILVGEEF
jgi:MoxR-like ATPase